MLPFVERPVALRDVFDAVQRAVIEKFVELMPHAGLEQFCFGPIARVFVNVRQTVEHVASVAGTIHKRVVTRPFNSRSRTSVSCTNLFLYINRKIILLR